MFEIKDSGERREFASGMVRDVTEGKTDYTLALDGPMFDRWAKHLTKGAEKYEARNWMKAEGVEEYDRFRQSALRHFLQWFRGEQDEDHAAAVFFNINGAEYVDDFQMEDTEFWDAMDQADWGLPCNPEDNCPECNGDLPAFRNQTLEPKGQIYEYDVPATAKVGAVTAQDIIEASAESPEDLADDYNYLRDRVLYLVNRLADYES